MYCNRPVIFIFLMYMVLTDASRCADGAIGLVTFTDEAEGQELDVVLLPGVWIKGKNKQFYHQYNFRPELGQNKRSSGLALSLFVCVCVSVSSAADVPGQALTEPFCLEIK